MISRRASKGYSQISFRCGSPVISIRLLMCFLIKSHHEKIKKTSGKNGNVKICFYVVFIFLMKDFILSTTSLEFIVLYSNFCDNDVIIARCLLFKIMEIVKK